MGQEEPEQLQLPGEGCPASACMCPVEIPDSFLWPQMNRHRWTQKRRALMWGWMGCPKTTTTRRTVPVERKPKPSLFAILIKWHLRVLSCWLLTLHIAPFPDECSRLCSLSVSYMTISSLCKIDCTFLPEMMGFPESWAHISLVLTHIGLLRF